MKKQKENSHEGITWSEMGKQNVQAEKVYCKDFGRCIDWLRLAAQSLYSISGHPEVFTANNNNEKGFT